MDATIPYTNCLCPLEFQLDKLFLICFPQTFCCVDWRADGCKDPTSLHTEAAMALCSPGCSGQCGQPQPLVLWSRLYQEWLCRVFKSQLIKRPLMLHRYPSLLWSAFAQRSLSRWPTYSSKQDGLQLMSSVSGRPCSQHGVQGSLGMHKYSLQKCVKLFGRWYGGQWETGGIVFSTNCPHLGWLDARSHVISLGHKA